MAKGIKLLLLVVVLLALYAGPAWAQDMPTPLPDVTITKRDAPDPVAVGDPLVYTVVVRNEDPGKVDDVVVEDRLPNGVRFIAASPSCERTGRVVTCEVGTLQPAGQPGESARIRIAVQPTEAGTITNRARACLDNCDSGTVIDRVREDTTVVRDEPEPPPPPPSPPPPPLPPFDGDFFEDFDEDFFDEERHILEEDEDLLDEEEDLLDEIDDDIDDGVSAEADEDGASADAGGTSAHAGDPDEQDPVSGPRGDVVDEIDTGGTPLPPTGGSPVATLTPLAGIALAPLVWIALLATGLSARWVRRRRRQ
jgi:uncharacterized repeat protein (TIGR01451 family)